MERKRSMVLTEAIQSGCCLLVFGLWAMDSFFCQESGHRTQGGQDACTIGVADLTAIFVVGSISHVVISVFDRPMSPRDVEQPLGVSRGVRLGKQTGDAKHRLVAFLAGGPFREVPVDPYDLCCSAKAYIFRADRQRPKFAHFDPAVLFSYTPDLRRMLRGGKSG